MKMSNMNIQKTKQKDDRKKASLIESASPQTPIYFSNGHFSKHHRVMKGRRLVSVPLHSTRSSTNYNSNYSSNCNYSAITADSSGGHDNSHNFDPYVSLKNGGEMSHHHSHSNNMNNSSTGNGNGNGNSTTNSNTIYTNYTNDITYSTSTNRAVRRVQMVSKRAALASKRKVR